MQHDNLGDDGYTNTLKGDRVAKDSCYCEVLGDLDSLQASLGKAKLYLPEEHNICRENTEKFVATSRRNKPWLDEPIN